MGTPRACRFQLVPDWITSTLFAPNTHHPNMFEHDIERLRICYLSPALLQRNKTHIYKMLGCCLFLGRGKNYPKMAAQEAAMADAPTIKLGTIDRRLWQCCCYNCISFVVALFANDFGIGHRAPLWCVSDRGPRFTQFAKLHSSHRWTSFTWPSLLWAENKINEWNNWIKTKY